MLWTLEVMPFLMFVKVTERESSGVYRCQFSCSTDTYCKTQWLTLNVQMRQVFDGQEPFPKLKCWDEFESDVQYPLKNRNCNATNDDLWNTVDVQIYKHAILKRIFTWKLSGNSAARTTKNKKQGNVQERTILAPPLMLVVFIFICLFVMFSWGLAWC